MPLRQALIEERKRRGWTQADLGLRLRLPQMHISQIETGKVVPRYDTLLELVRILGQDLILAPRELGPVMQQWVRDRRKQITSGTDGEGSEYEEQPFYTIMSTMRIVRH